MAAKAATQPVRRRWESRTPGRFDNRRRVNSPTRQDTLPRTFSRQTTATRGSVKEKGIESPLPTLRRAKRSSTYRSRPATEKPQPATASSRQQPRPRRSPWYRVWDAFSLEKAFVIFGFSVALIMVLLFGLDLATGLPFWRASTLWDATAVICGLVLGYLSWDTWRDLS